ncbi:MAG: DUF6448 family protein [Opitutaceae bacterium]|nr:DUF6448 family protein [Opitutaceae bacterium]
MALTPPSGATSVLASAPLMVKNPDCTTWPGDCAAAGPFAAVVNVKPQTTKPMKNTNLKQALTTLTMLTAAALLAPHAARAHCDSLDGPVVKAARAALTEDNVNLVVIWVQKADEAEIKHTFERTLAVRKLNAEARELADRYFFETLASKGCMTRRPARLTASPPKPKELRHLLTRTRSKL